MPSVSLDYLRTHLDETVALADAEEVVITRDAGENLMMVKEADWRALQETVHLLATPLNADRVQTSLQSVRIEYLLESKIE
ncbi:MAG: type II toxin-antitoxin system Phd/YefM family antitoxin [Pseudomonadota bacterium]